MVHAHSIMPVQFFFTYLGSTHKNIFQHILWAPQSIVLKDIFVSTRVAHGHCLGARLVLEGLVRVRVRVRVGVRVRGEVRGWKELAPNPNHHPSP